MHSTTSGADTPSIRRQGAASVPSSGGTAALHGPAGRTTSQALLHSLLNIAHVMRQDGGDPSILGHFIVILLTIVDGIQVLALCLSPAFGWDMRQLSWIHFDIMALIISRRSASLFFAMFAVAAGIVLFVVVDTLWVGHSFLRDKFHAMWPARMLRSVISLVVSAAFIPLLRVLMIPTSCLSLQRFEVVAEGDCNGATRITLMVAAIILVVCFLPLAWLAALLFHEISPSSRDLRAKANGRDLFLHVVVRTAMVFVSGFVLQHASLTSPGVMAVLLLFLGLTSWLLVSHLFHVPFYNLQMNQLRAGLLSSAVWACTSSLAMLSSALSGTVAPDDRLRMAVGLLSCIPLAFLAGWQLPRWKLGRLSRIHLQWLLYSWRQVAQQEQAEAAATAPERQQRVQFASTTPAQAAATAAAAAAAATAAPATAAPADNTKDSTRSGLSTPRVRRSSLSTSSAAAAAALVAAHSSQADPAEKLQLINATSVARPAMDLVRSSFGNSAWNVEVMARAALLNTVPPMPPQEAAIKVVNGIDSGAGRGFGAVAPVHDLGLGSGPVPTPEVTPAMWRRWYYTQVRQGHVPKWNVDCAAAVYQAGDKAFPDDPYLRICYAYFTSAYRQSPLQATVLLSRVKKMKLPFDLQFILFDEAKRLEEQRQADNLGEQQALDAVGVIAFRQQQRRALVQHRTAVSLIADFWQKVKDGSNAKPRVRAITKRLERITTARDAARKAYQSMVHRFPTSAILLRCYADFAGSVLNDPALAAKVQSQARLAEEPDEADGQSRRSGISVSKSLRSRSTGRPSDHSSGASGSNWVDLESQIKPKPGSGIEILRYGTVVRWGIVLVAALAIGVFLLYNHIQESYDASIQVIDSAGIRRAHTVNLLYSTRALVAAVTSGSSAAAEEAARARLRNVARLFRTVHTNLYHEDAGIAGVDAWYNDPDSVAMVLRNAGPPPRFQHTGMSYLDAGELLVSQATEVANLNRTRLLATAVADRSSFRSICDNAAHIALPAAFELVELWNDHLLKEYVPLVAWSVVACILVLALVGVLVCTVFGNSLVAVEQASHGIPDVVTTLPRKTLRTLVTTYSRIKKELQDFSDDLKREDDGASDRGLSSDEQEGSGADGCLGDAEETQLPPVGMLQLGMLDTGRRGDGCHDDQRGLGEASARSSGRLGDLGDDQAAAADGPSDGPAHAALVGADGGLNSDNTAEPSESPSSGLGAALEVCSDNKEATDLKASDSSGDHDCNEGGAEEGGARETRRQQPGRKRGLAAASIDSNRAPHVNTTSPTRDGSPMQRHSFNRGRPVSTLAASRSERPHRTSSRGERTHLTSPLAASRGLGPLAEASTPVAASRSSRVSTRNAGSPTAKQRRRSHLASDASRLFSDVVASATTPEPTRVDSASEDEQGKRPPVMTMCVTGCGVWGAVICRNERVLALKLQRIAWQVLLAALLVVTMQCAALAVQLDLLRQERGLASTFNLAGQRRMFTLSIHALSQEVLMADEQVMPLGVSVLMLRSAVDRLRTIHNMLRFGDDQAGVAGIGSGHDLEDLEATGAFDAIEGDSEVDVQLRNAANNGVNSVVQLYLLRAESILARFESGLDSAAMASDWPELADLRWGFDELPRYYNSSEEAQLAVDVNQEWISRSLRLPWDDEMLAQAKYKYFSDSFNPRMAGIVGPNMTALQGDTDFTFVARLNLEVAGSAMQEGTAGLIKAAAARGRTIKFVMLVLNVSVLFGVQLLVFRRMFVQLADEAGRKEDLLRLIPTKVVLEEVALHRFFSMPDDAEALIRPSNSEQAAAGSGHGS